MGIDFVIIQDRDSSHNADIVNVLDNVLAHRVSTDIWDWEFNTNRHTIFSVAKDGNVIVGTQSMLPVTLFVSGKKVFTAKSETSYLFSEYRGKGIFEKLYLIAIDAAVKNGTEIIWGFTPAIKAWKNNLKFEVRENLPSSAILVTHNYSYEHLAAKSDNWVLTFARYLKNKLKYKKFSDFKKSLHFDVDLIVKEDIGNVSDFEELYNKIESEHKDIIHIAMTNEYYHWRVLDNPVLNYRKLFFYRDKTLVGYILYTRNDYAISIADITYNLDLPVLETMFSHLIDRENPVHYISYWGNRESIINEDFFNLLEKAGGVVCKDQDRHFVFQKYSNDIASSTLFNMRNWYINGLWTEGFDI